MIFIKSHKTGGIGKRIHRLESFPSVKSIKQGLVMSIPILMTGSIALILMNFPIDAYVKFINDFGGGFIYRFFNLIYGATFSFLSVYMVLNISKCYAENIYPQTENDYVTVRKISPIVSLCAFCAMNGIGTEYFTIDVLGVKGMFTAIVVAIGATKLYVMLHLTKRINIRLFSDGTDMAFNRSVTAILPIFITVASFALVNTAIILIFKVSGLNGLFVMLVGLIFKNLEGSLISGLLFVFLSSVFWFFGIHGSNVLEEISQSFFVGGLDANIVNIQSGRPPEVILTKQFFDIFVLMGGCGSAICLLLALLIFGRRKGTKRLAKIASLPMLFNINELMIFGLPVVFNASFLIPFIITPLVCTVTSYFAMYHGLVPLTQSDVQWVTPALWGGYLCTNSIKGLLLQLFNIIVGTAIYSPFVIAYEKHRFINLSEGLESLIGIFEKYEKAGESVALTELKNSAGDIAKMLAADMKDAILHNEFRLFYQPQFDKDKRCIGAEALLRWKHKSLGYIYPPLIIGLAKEAGLLKELEFYVFRTAAQDKLLLNKSFSNNIRICVNITPEIMADEDFLDFLRELTTNFKLCKNEICIEVTEQSALTLDAESEKKLADIRALGFLLAIDDFSMGYTSLKYLQNNNFDMVKLDGSLIKGMRDNLRCADIVESIIHLSHSLNFSVLAEYVETEEQLSALAALGCNEYQGYLCSPAIPFQKFVAYVEKQAEKTLKTES